MRPFPLIAAVLLTGACKTGSPPSPHGEPQPSTAAPASATPADPSGSASAAPPPGAPVSGKVPFDLPRAAITAQAGDFVLAPPRAWLDEALERGAKTQTFMFYGAWMQAPGQEGSHIRTRPGPTEAIPNTLVIPIRRGQRVERGAIVLTAWASGAGLQRAIVVAGGEPASPRVRYLDLAFDHPSGWGQKDDALPPNTFHELKQPGEVGTTVACRQGAVRTHLIAVHQAGDKLLGLNFAGQLSVLARSDCSAVPLAPEVEKGDTVWVPVVGTFSVARVTRIEAEIGRVHVEYRVGKEKREGAFAFTNVATELEPAPSE